MHHRTQTTAVVAALVALTFWGGTAIANRYAVGFADAVSVATLRSMLAGLLALGTAFALRLKWPSNRSDRLLLLMSGLFSFAFWPILLSLGLERTTASHAALIMATLPIIAVLLASLVNRTMPSFGWWVGGMMALAGALFLVVDRDAMSASIDWQSAAAGDLIILLGCVLCAASYIAAGKLSPKIGAFATTFWGLSIALLVTVPTFAIYQQGTDWAALPSAAWWAIAWLTFCSSLIGYVLWFFALGRGGIERISSLQLLMPVITLVGATLILNEVFTLRLALLASLVLAGTVVAHQFSNRDK